MRSVLGVFLLTASSSAFGFPFYPDRIPNGRNAEELGLSRPCGICHDDSAGGGSLNAFGTDFEAQPRWPSVFDLDSDGDGQSNGLELGDPSGVWDLGRTPERTIDLSLPGNPNSSSPDGPQPEPGRDAGFDDLGFDTGRADDGSGFEPDTGFVDAGMDDAGGMVPASGQADVGPSRPDGGLAPESALGSSTIGAGCTCGSTHSRPPGSLLVFGAIGMILGTRARRLARSRPPA